MVITLGQPLFRIVKNSPPPIVNNVLNASAVKNI